MSQLANAGLITLSNVLHAELHEFRLRIGNAAERESAAFAPRLFILDTALHMHFLSVEASPTPILRRRFMLVVFGVSSTKKGLKFKF